MLRGAAGWLLRARRAPFCADASLSPAPPARHLEALRIFVHRLRQPRLAEAYCDRVYRRRQAARAEARAAQQRRRRASSPPEADLFGQAAAAVPPPQQQQPAAASWQAPSSGGAGGAPPSSPDAEGDHDIYLLLIQVGTAAWYCRGRQCTARGAGPCCDRMRPYP